jgi:hypothetical protein
MSLKMMNEAFKRKYSGVLTESVDNSELTQLKEALVMKSMSTIANGGNLKSLEEGLQEVIEDHFPDHDWWEVTDCQIFNELFSGTKPREVCDMIVEQIKPEFVATNKEYLTESSVDYIKWVQLPDGEWRLWGSNDGPELDPEFLGRASKQNGIKYTDARVTKNGETPVGVEDKDIYDKHRFGSDEPPVEESVSNPDRTRGKVSKNLSKSVDKDLVRDLTLIIENDGDIYRRFTTPVINNLKRKKAKGQFDEELAVQAFVHVVENALRQPYFYRYYSYDIKTVPVPERYAVAKELLDGAMDEIEFEGDSLTEAPIYDLDTQYDSRRSFYSKAKVDTGDDGDKNKLYSYNTLVAEIVDGKPVVHGTYSATTLRHIKEWLKQLGYRADSAKQIMQDYGAVNESATGRDSTHNDVILDRSQPDFHSEYMRLTELGYETVWSGEGKIKLKYTGKSVPKRREFFAEDLSDLGIKNNIIEFPSGDYVYVDYQNGKLVAGGATNQGIMPEYEIDFDEDLSVEANLENLYDEIISSNPEFLGESLCRKLRECLRRLRESSISPEDQADSDLIRSMIAKLQKRSNSKFTAEEQAVLDKYGITRDNWRKKLMVGDRELNPDYDGKTSRGYEFSRVTPSWIETTHRNGDTSRINYADRARKLPQRGADQVAGNWTPNGYINAHTRRDGSTLQGVERAVAADRDREPVTTMKRHLWDRKYSQGRMDNAQSEYDKTVGKAQAEFDRQVRWATDTYRRDTVDARQNRDAAQDKIDRMLGRK